MHLQHITLTVANLRQSFHTYSIAYAEGGFLSRLNPFSKAKEDKIPKPDENLRKKELQDLVDTNKLEVEKEHTQQAFQPIKDRDAVIEIMKEITLNNGGTEDTWRTMAFRTPHHKFTILKKGLTRIGKDIPNLELNNIKTIDDAINFFSRKEEFDSRNVKNIVEQSLKKLDEEQELPPNMSFVPREHNKPHSRYQKKHEAEAS